MKVNIIGKGIVPGIGSLAPIYNRELTPPEIQRLLNFPDFKVYCVDTTLLITKKNFKSMMEADKIVPVNTSSILDTTTTFVEESVKHEPLPEITEDLVTEVLVAEPVVEENVVEETVVSENNENEEVVEEEPVEQTQTYSKKKNKKRNRNNNQ